VRSALQSGTAPRPDHLTPPPRSPRAPAPRRFSSPCT